ncbi:MAG: N-acetylmuramoyl-L-alanine amidase [Candidatus Marinimicrobia bacterium]|nr:N-acetylmuramoyl-L-alanine amidase [Candidatus Neomarinimicrobiota bacterium]
MINIRKGASGKKVKHGVVFLLSLLMLNSLAAASELRGLVVQGSDWAFAQGAAAMQAGIREIMTTAREKGFNTIFFQVREAGECFYPSEYETWSALFGEQDPGFDPLAFALNEAHQNGMQFHVQIEVLTAYSLVNKPKSADHLYMRNGTKWVIADDNFKPVIGEYAYYLDPLNPEVISYLKRQVAEITGRYAIDGVYFSHLRFPDNTYIANRSFLSFYNNVSAFTLNTKEVLAQEILTSCLEALVSEIKLVKPYLTVFAETEPMVSQIKGIKELLPADSYYFQNGISWLKEGLVDVLVPRIHVRYKTFDDLYLAYLREAEAAPDWVVPSLRGDVESFHSADVAKELDLIRKEQGKGSIIFSASDIMKGPSIFEEAAELPFLARTHEKTSAAEIDLSSKSIPNDMVRLGANGRIRIVDQQNRLNLMLDALPRTLALETLREKMRYSTREWVVPYRYVAVSNNGLERPDPFIELRRAPSFMTPDSSFNFLFRASPGTTCINGTELIAYPHTHIFFQDIAFKPFGKRTIVRGTVSKEGETRFYETIYYGNMPDTTTKHAVIMKSVSPQGTVILPPEDMLRITFQSHLAEAMDTILLYANGKAFPLWYNGNRYVGELPCALFEAEGSAFIQVAARDNRGKNYSYNLPISLKVQPAYRFPLIETREDFAQVSFSSGDVRLGGPYIHEYPTGVRFRTNGKIGENYRVRLGATDMGYISEKQVRELAPGMPAPAYNITSMSIRPDSAKDVLTIPWPEPVPYAVTPQPEQNRIRITLYGVSSNSTWISHREGLKIIDYVTWEQRDAETYDIYVYLQDNNIWGYDLVAGNRFLSFSIKYPPVRTALRIAIEAGHGGDWNWGAVGLSGLKEKDVNRDTAEKVRDMLRSMGYDVVEVRPEDSSPMLRERWLLTDSLQADVFISIHANAGGKGYLSVAGTSTYYNNPFWREFAEIGYAKLRELPLEEFGIVGSFNYMMCRMTQRPSMLVEQAFMSHAEDEDKLADPEFRTKIAEKIAQTVDEYVNMKLRR